MRSTRSDCAQQQHAVIDDLIVHPGWCRRDIARRLYDACEEWIRERKASWVEVNVYEFNAQAHDFYASIGFKTTLRKLYREVNI